MQANIILGWADNSQTPQLYNAMSENRKKPYELGRRLGQQGPRQTVGNQAALCEKLATGKKKQINNIPQPCPTRKPNRSKDKRSTNVKTRHKSQLNILQLNICGLKNKKLELSKLMNEYQIHIALLQETLHKKIDTHIAGYTRAIPVNALPAEE